MNIKFFFSRVAVNILQLTTTTLMSKTPIGFRGNRSAYDTLDNCWNLLIKMVMLEARFYSSFQEGHHKKM